MPVHKNSTDSTAKPSRGHSKRARTRERLVDGALSMLADNTLENASILELATAAGVSNGTFYNYFQTKEALVEAVAARLSEQMAVQLREEFTGVEDPAERIVIAARTFMQRALKEPVFGWALLRLIGTLPRLSETVRQSILLDVREGLAKGRFRFSSEAAAADMVMGSQIVGIRSLLEQRVGEEHIRGISEISLMGLGMELEQALEVVDRLVP